MDQFLYDLLSDFHVLILIAVIVGSLAALGKGADLLVDEAVRLSVKSGIPTVVVGATIVSLGTTMPEAAVSVFASVQGNPDLALGNAVGSIICDTGLIIGLAALIRPLPLNRSVTNRQGWLQIGFPALLVSVAIFSLAGAVGTLFTADTAPGYVPQWMGFVFIGLLIGYIYLTIRWSKRDKEKDIDAAEEVLSQVAEGASTGIVLLRLIIGVLIIVASSKLLIPAVEITAVRAGIPAAVIAATMVALGTSLPELVTAITATRKGHGELAIGNVIGADILNVLFVAGVSAAVTPGGLVVPGFFFHLQFPAMIVLLALFRFITLAAKKEVGRPAGAALLAIYAVYVVISYVT